MTDITQRATELHDQWLAFGGKISRETAEVLSAMAEELRQARKCGRLVRDLLNPEMFGHAANAEIRDAARAALGLPAVELKTRMESFNESDARRTALGWPRGSLGEEVHP